MKRALVLRGGVLKACDNGSALPPCGQGLAKPIGRRTGVGFLAYVFKWRQ
jgi:hypothetical protein